MRAAQYIKRQILTMCARFKGRSGGSLMEQQCQEYIREEMEGYADTVNTQEFVVHPDAGWGWLVVTGVSALLSLTLPLFNMQSIILSALAWLLSMLAVAVTVFQFLMGYHMIDRFFPKRKGFNVIATVKPNGQIRRRLVFAGHADAAYEMTFSHRGGAPMVLRVTVTSMICLALMFILNTALFLRCVISGSIEMGSGWYCLRIGGLLLIPLFVRALFFFNRRCIVDGANDNLSGCAVAMAALRELSFRDARLENTEVCCLVTSSEECGLRGAHAFGKLYKQEVNDVDTVFVVLDTLHDTENLMVYTQGMNGFQKNSLQVARLIQSAAEDIGLNLPVAGQYLGATDAEALSRAGLEACAICGVDHTPQPYYHTRADNADNINEECLDVCVKLCLEIAYQFDRQAEVADVALPEAVLETA